MMGIRPDAIYEFEDFRLDAAHLLLYREGDEIPLAPKVVKTLLALVERAGEVLSKDELMKLIWADLSVEENNLSQNLYRLRKVFEGPAPGAKRPLIETLKRRGYRFNADVVWTRSAKPVTDNVPLVDEETEFRKSGKPRIMEGQSIAVLPFANMTRDAENEYFCDGLAEEILNALAKFNDLNVAARTSAFFFKNKDISVAEIGSCLGVKTVLEGSVRKSGDRMRITAQLIDASNGYHLWSERYDKAMGDVFDVQDEITKSVVAALKVTLFGESPPRKRRTSDRQAYEFHLRGLFHFYKRTTEDLRTAIELFEKALAIDPHYVSAYVGLADCLLLMVVYTGTSASEALPRAGTAAARAVALDNSLAEAHATLGHYYFRSLEWVNAEREIARAVGLNTAYAAAHFWSSEYSRCMRRFDESLRAIERALELDMFSPSYRTFLGVARYNLGDVAAAVRELEQVLEFDPDFLMSHFFLTDALAESKRWDEAIARAERAVELSGEGSLFLASLGRVYGLAGKGVEAEYVIGRLREKRSAGTAVGFHFAQVYTGLGENASAIDWLERDLAEGETVLLTNITAGYLYDRLSTDSRFGNILRQMGLGKVLDFQAR